MKYSILAFIFSFVFTHAQAAPDRTLSDTFVLNENVVVFFQSKAKGVDFKTCDESIIVDFIGKYFDKNNYNKQNEFGKKKFVNIVRDTLDAWQKTLSYSDIYNYSTTRLLGDYDFSKKQFPIVGYYYTNSGMFSYTSYKNETQVINEHISKGVNLVNADAFPLFLKLNEDEAEKVLLLKKQICKEYLDSLYSTMDESTKIFMMRKGIKLSDDYGNYADNEDRRVYFRYYIRFLDPQDNKAGKKKASKFIASLVNTSGVEKVEEDQNTPKCEVVMVEVYLKKGSTEESNYLYRFYPDGRSVKLISAK